MKDFFNKETLDNIKQFCAENKKYVDYTKALDRSEKTEVYVYVEKAFVVHCCFSGDSLELCLHRNGR